MNTPTQRALASITPLGGVAKSTYKAPIFEALHTLIQRLELPPGERLVEADLAARFGVSKTPVREALLLLARDHLVSLVPHVGATVTWLTLAGYEENLFILDALEQPALPLVAERITPPTLEECARILEATKGAHARREAHQYHLLMDRLHETLFAAARYPRLLELIIATRRMGGRYHMVFVQPFAENLERELAVLVQRFEHLRAGDAAAAAAAVRQGHAAMLAFARERVAARDPIVMPYIREAGAADPTPAVRRSSRVLWR